MPVVSDGIGRVYGVSGCEDGSGVVTSVVDAMLGIMLNHELVIFIQSHSVHACIYCTK